MNVHDRIAADKADVERLRRILSNMDTRTRRLQAMGGEMMLTTGTDAATYAELAVIMPDASDAERDFYLLGPALALSALRRIDRADAWFRQNRERQHPAHPEPREKKHGSECAMLCNKQAFGRFLAEVHGATYGPVDPLDPDSVATAVKKILAIESRAVLNHDAEAVGRWIKLRDEYQAWMRS